MSDSQLNGLQVGAVVHYVLNQEDVNAINRRRPLSGTASGVPLFAQHHTGNPVSVGEHVAMMVVAIWRNEFGEGKHGVNGQCMLDGNDSLWVTSVGFAFPSLPGTWHWMEAGL